MALRAHAPILARTVPSSWLTSNTTASSTPTTIPAYHASSTLTLQNYPRRQSDSNHQTYMSHVKPSPHGNTTLSPRFMWHYQKLGGLNSHRDANAARCPGVLDLPYWAHEKSRSSGFMTPPWEAGVLDPAERIKKRMQTVFSSELIGKSIRTSARTTIDAD